MLRNWPAPLCLAALACALAGAPSPWRAWQSLHDRDHPLAGRVLDLRARRSLSPEDLLDRLAGARFVLLGEKHDNPDHHRLQAWVIEGLARRGQARAVVLEMLPRDAAEALARQRSARPGDVDGIARAVGWERGGWPEWKLYRPIFAAALAAGLPVAAGDLSRAELAALRAGGAPSAELMPLGLDRPLAPAARAQLEADLERSHCGALPPGAVERLIGIQRARDARLAASLVEAATPHGAILIAGAGHVGLEWGVPAYLERAAPGDSSVSLALLEVDPDRREIAAYLESPPRFHHVWLTPRVDIRDPCERFREQLRRMHPPA